MNKPLLREGFQPDKAPPPAIEPQAPEAPALPPEVWPIRIELRKPILDPSKPEPIRELVLRQPTGGDINRCGNPIRMGTNGFEIDTPKMHQMIGAVAGILTPLLDQMDSRDWNTVAYRLFRFFVPGSAAWD
jgi:hypothetical protein